MPPTRALTMRLLLLIALLMFGAPPVPASPQPGSRPGEPGIRRLLRDISAAQERYRASHGRYTASARELGVARVPGMQVRLLAEGARGFSAVAITTDAECAVFHGRARPPRSYARTPGTVACRARRGGGGVG